MRLTAILAISQCGAIGQTSSPTGMPWPRLARDLRRFRDATMGRVCIVGRKTYDTLPPLKGRRLAVLTRDVRSVVATGVRYYDATAAINAARWAGESEVMVIGGAEVYRQLLPDCDRILLTEVMASYPAADVRLGSVADVTHGCTMLARETLDPDETTPVSDGVRRERD